MVLTLVALALGRLSGQSYHLLCESGIRCTGFSVSTTWRLCNFSSFDYGTQETLKKPSYYHHYHHHYRPPPPLLCPKVKRKIYHKLNSQVSLECSFLQILSSVILALTSIRPKGLLSHLVTQLSCIFFTPLIAIEIMR